MLFCYKSNIFDPFPPQIFACGRKRDHLQDFLVLGFFEIIILFLIFIVLHTPITTSNQASFNLFFSIPFLHGCHTPSIIFLIFVQLLWTVFLSWFMEVAENSDRTKIGIAFSYYLYGI